MEMSLIKSVPPGSFVEVSALSRDWQSRLQSLLNQKQHIKYDFYPLQDFPEEIRSQLKEHGYCELVLESDQWQHFLIPNSSVN